MAVTVAEDAAHQYRLVDEPSDSWDDPTQYEQSTEVIDILNDRLTEIGY